MQEDAKPAAPDGDVRPPQLFCGDDELGYLRSRTRFAAGEGLALDDAYCLAHLPLVAPRHPRVVARREGTPYESGRHPPIFSLVLPVPGDALNRSAAYRKLTSELQASAFAPKIAWHLIERRERKLHATLCGSLAFGEQAPALDDLQRRELASLGPMEVELRGLFSGSVNVGRLYLRAYPQWRDGVNAFQQIQQVFGRRPTDLYPVGIFNLVDGLDASEASALSRIIERWWTKPILRFRADHLWLLRASDDLVLNSLVIDTIALSCANVRRCVGGKNLSIRARARPGK